MSKEVDEAYEKWLKHRKGTNVSAYKTWCASAAAERARCVAAVEAQRVTHDGTNCPVLRPDCGQCYRNDVLDGVLTAIRGTAEERNQNDGQTSER